MATIKNIKIIRNGRAELHSTNVNFGYSKVLHLSSKMILTFNREFELILGESRESSSLLLISSFKMHIVKTSES